MLFGFALSSCQRQGIIYRFQLRPFPLRSVHPKPGLVSSHQRENHVQTSDSAASEGLIANYAVTFQVVQKMGEKM